MGKHSLFLHLNMLRVEKPEIGRGGTKLLFLFRLKWAFGDPRRVKGLGGVVQFAGPAMVSLKRVQICKGASAGYSAEAWKHGLFFIGSVPLATHTKVLKCRLHGCRLFVGQGSSLSTVSDEAEDVEKVLNPAMTIDEHPDRIIESAIRLCADLYARHVLSFAFDPLGTRGKRAENHAFI